MTDLKTLDLSAAMFQVQKALDKSQGSDVTIEFRSVDGHAVKINAFIAGGNVRPGSFKSTWIVDGVSMSKSAATKIVKR